jgi:AAA family ATPase
LFGPPGTGKSTLARAAACEAGVPLFAIKGPDIVSQFYGESEQALRAVFAAAEQAAPSVVNYSYPFDYSPSRWFQGSVRQEFL